ncbi:MAG: hypothetical protein KAV87_41275 [Desulfobacteraceae bacterium]|nr:hypothetical protein [Desulfobacteraceae bacterium]
METHERETLIKYADCMAKVSVVAALELLPVIFEYGNVKHSGVLVEGLDTFLTAFVFGMGFTSDIYGVEDHKPLLIPRYLASARKEFRTVADEYPDFPLRKVLDRLRIIEEGYRPTDKQN